MKKIKNILSVVLSTLSLTFASNPYAITKADVVYVEKISDYTCIDVSMFEPFENYTILRKLNTKDYIYMDNKWGKGSFGTAGIYHEIYLIPTEKINSFEEYINTNYPDFTLEKTGNTMVDTIGEKSEMRIVYNIEFSEDEKWEIARNIYENTGLTFGFAPFEDMVAIDCTGDTNLDYSINISDVLAVSAHINNKDKYPMDEQSIINGDVHDTGNGLNSSDAFMIQQYITGVIESL